MVCTKFLVAILAGLVVAARPDTALAVRPVNVDRWSGAAIKGYDPVAYFKQGEAAKGDRATTAEWSGATWRFSSEANRALFVATPEAYAPQYGGYCAYAVSNGEIAGIDPEAWSIVDGKLYLNYSRKVKAKWEPERAGRIRKADELWPGLLAKEE